MKWIPIFPLLLLTLNSLFAQTPEKISYQAVIRDNSQTLVTSSDVDLKIIVRQGSVKGTAVYEETHYTTTNNNGLVSLQIGTGIINSGSFENINWAKGSYYIESQVDPTGSSNYTITGVSQILSVPYSLHSKTTENFKGSISEAQISDLHHYSDADINGFEIAFEGWDKDTSDDFDGKYSSLTGLPDIFTKSEIIQLLSENETPSRLTQSLTLTETELSISGGNSISFENWDRDVSDDFSGDYTDLKNKPKLFSGDYKDLINTPSSFSGNFEDLQGLPKLYTKSEIDSLIVIRGGSEGSIQSLNLEDDQLSISGGNTISLGELKGDFSGDYIDLKNKPELFSGEFHDLLNTPEIYTRTQVDSLIVTRSGSEGSIQSLNLEGDQLSISGGNTISLGELTGDFSGSYLDLEDRPELFSGDFADLLNTPEIYTRTQVDSLIVTRSGSEGSIQSLNLEGDQLAISGGNTVSLGELTGNFSGSYLDLEDRPELFSGDFADLNGIPQIYTKTQVDSLIVTRENSEGIVQSLSLVGSELNISGGNSISFEGWDINNSDDFSGDYLDLKNLPEIYTIAQVDSLVLNSTGEGATVQTLILEGEHLAISGGNSISFDNWDTNASDDFSGTYDDLQNKPELFNGEFNALKNLPDLYTAEEVDNLINGIETNGGVSQNLNLDQTTLSITGGNSILFDNWDTNANDDFSGIYDDLKNIPEQYTKNEVDVLISNIQTTGGEPQILTLAGRELLISNGNSIIFDNWDTNAADDFNGEYSSLENAPKVYTQSQVDSIQNVLLANIAKDYVKKPEIRNFTNSRNIVAEDIGNTLACSISGTLTISSNFNTMKVGETVNIEIHGTKLTVKGSSGVIINGSSAGSAEVGNNAAYTGGIIRKIDSNAYIVL